MKSSLVALVSPVRISIAASEGKASTSWRRLAMFQAASYRLQMFLPGILSSPCFCKSLDPILEHADDWLSHVEDNVINQLEVDRPTLLMNWQLVESLVNDIPKVTS